MLSRDIIIPLIRKSNTDTLEWNGRHVNGTAEEHKDVTVFTGNYR
jgi:hypothetical protein